MTTTVKITTEGMDSMKGDFLQLFGDVVQFGEIGTGTAAAAAGDTDLGSAISGSNRRWEDVTVGANYVEFTYRAGFSEFDGNDITEIGGKDSSGNLYFRITFDALSKTTSNEYVLTIRIQLDITQN